MALRLKVLSKKVQKFERKGIDGYNINNELFPVLDDILDGVFSASRPKPVEYDARRDLVRVFNDIAKEVFAKSGDVPTVVEFGSFVMDLFSSKSDLDLSFNFNLGKVEITREKKIQALRKLARKLYALQSCGHVYGVHPITTAKVPILKVVDLGTGVECDLSVENRDGVLKSQLIQMICSIDERFRKLSFLMKLWAKAQKINSSKDGTLNSLSIILLVAFHLQTRSPPILPPFRALFKDGADPSSVARVLSNFANYGRDNKESVAQLLLSLLIKLASVQKLWPKGLCASVYEGSWTSKTWESKVATISVEDFTDRSQNVARAVTPAESKVIYKCIQQSIRCILAFLDGQMEGSRLQQLLFDKAAKPLVGAPVTNFRLTALAPPANATAAVIPVVGLEEKQNTHISHKRAHVKSTGFPLAKKMCYTSEGSTGAPSGNWGETSSANWFASKQVHHSELEKAQWGTSWTNNWGGTSSGNWGETSSASWLTSKQVQHSELEKAQWGTSWKNNWGGTPSGNWGETSSANWFTSKQVQHSELEKAQWGTSWKNNWGGTHWPRGWDG